MNPFIALHLLASALYLFLGIFAVHRNPGSSPNRLFMMISACFSLWAFCFVFIHDPAIDAASRERWYDISSIGWCLFSCFTLHFFMELVGLGKLMRRWWMYLVLYGPAVVLVAREMTGTMAATGFVRVGWGFSEIPATDGPWYYLFLIEQSGYTAIGTALLFAWWRRSTFNRERLQARLLAITALFSVVVGFTIDILFPLLGLYILPVVSPLAVFILAVGFWIAITRYELMSFNLANAAGDIVLNMQDLLVLAGPDGRIVKVNARVTGLLGLSESDMIGSPVSQLAADREVFHAAYRQMLAPRVTTLDVDGDVLASDGTVIPMHIRATWLVDRFGDRRGMVLIANDLREKRHLQREIEERIRAEEMLRYRNETMERDLANAQMIQKALLPATVPVHPRLRTDFRHLPMDAVGGDFLAFTQYPGGELGVFVGDVSGHGVTAALFLSLLKAEFDRTCRTCGLEPARFIGELNRSLIHTRQGINITALYGVFWAGVDGVLQFTFSKGGHPEPISLIPASGTVTYHECRGPLLGVFDHARFEQCTIALQPGSRFFVYTDGLVETRDGMREMFGFPRLAQSIDKTVASSLTDTLDAIIASVTDFRGEAAVEDDIILAGFEIR